MRDDKFVIKVSRQALYPGHTLRGAHSVHSKPALAGFWRVNCFALQSACWLLESHVAMCWLLGGGQIRDQSFVSDLPPPGYWNHRLPGFPGEVVGDRLWRG